LQVRFSDRSASKRKTDYQSGKQQGNHQRDQKGGAVPALLGCNGSVDCSQLGEHFQIRNR
jgi:hypothetical protein